MEMPKCTASVPMDVGGIILSAGLAVATPIPFIPQIFKICRTASADGLSLSTLVLTVLLCAGNTAAGLLTKWDQLNACPSLGLGCLPDLLDLLQLVLLATASAVILLLAVAYEPLRAQRSAKLAALASALVMILLWGASIAISVVTPCGAVAMQLASALAWVGAVVAVMQYLPQLVETCRHRSSGSLSASSYLLTALGGYAVFVDAAFVSADPWPVWAPLLTSTAMQTATALLCIYFDGCRRLRRARPSQPLLEEHSMAQDPAASLSDACKWPGASATPTTPLAALPSDSP